MKNFINWLKGLFIHKHKWVVKRTIWPYPDGWGVQCTKCKAIAEAGMEDKESAESLRELLEEYHSYRRLVWR